jgi:hypothetical protein
VLESPDLLGYHLVLPSKSTDLIPFSAHPLCIFSEFPST